VRELAAALGLIGIGQAKGDFVVSTGATPQGSRGVLKVASDLGETAVFFAANHRASVQLHASGIIDWSMSDVLVIHSHEQPEARQRSPADRWSDRPRAQRDVGMAELLREASGVVDLEQRFREASSL